MFLSLKNFGIESGKKCLVLGLSASQLLIFLITGENFGLCSAQVEKGENYCISRFLFLERVERGYGGAAKPEDYLDRIESIPAG